MYAICTGGSSRVFDSFPRHHSINRKMYLGLGMRLNGDGKVHPSSKKSLHSLARANFHSTSRSSYGYEKYHWYVTRASCVTTLQWRRNGRNGVSNHQLHHCLFIYSGADQRKHQSSASLAFLAGKFPTQMASNAGNVSIWWRHHNKSCYRIYIVH